ncbi:hypothetical protein Zmor_018873 [Zophobas morio]|uniref:Fatty acid synthase n=1 Tax=Zophobas morio TaxID=2755281 RepID=A0AA38ID47_9CUCU|nr:hypothetical protein Zmor_018873 [Zophobas morio]
MLSAKLKRLQDFKVLDLAILKLGVLSPDGECKVFDESASGYARSDAIACVFLQKAKHAKRIYAKITHIRTGSEGYKVGGLLAPSSKTQTELIEATLSESGIHPSQIGYLETHGTGTILGDPQEAESIDVAIAQKRQKPLPIGATKNSIGHTEAAAGLCALVKAIIAMESGLIPPTINIDQLRKGIKGFEENRMRVVTQAEELPNNTYIGINCFGWGANIAHLIVEPASKKVDNESTPNDFPKLVLVSGRNKQAVVETLHQINRQPNADFVNLLHHIFKDNVNGHMYRGFTILEDGQQAEISVELYRQHPKKLFVFFGPLESGFLSLKQQSIKVSLFRDTVVRVLKRFVQLKANFDENDTLLGGFAVQLGIAKVLRVLKVELTPVAEDSFHQVLVLYCKGKISLEEAVEMAIKSKPNKNNNHSVDISKHSIMLNLSDKPLRINNDDMVLTTNFFHILGRLYQEGHDLQIHKLYPNAQFPVNRNTPMLSHLIKWNCDKNWYSYKFSEDTDTPLQKSYKITDHEYLTGHQIDGLGTIPPSEILNLVWQTFKSRLVPAIVFENCEFVEVVPLDNIDIFVSILPKSGKFEVCKDNKVVACGRVFVPDDIKKYQMSVPWFGQKSSETLTQNEVYKTLNLKGGLFQGVEKCDLEVSEGSLRWENNWTTFIDSIIQTVQLQDSTHLLRLPVGIRRLTIDVNSHLKIVNETKSCHFCFHKKSRTIRSGGIEIFDVSTKLRQRQCQQSPVLEKYVFVPNVVTLDLEESLIVNTQIIVEKSLTSCIKAVEIVDDNSDSLLPLVHRIIQRMPTVTSEFTICATKYPEIIDKSKNLLLVVGTKVLQKPELLDQILALVSQDGFILTREKPSFRYKEVANLELLTEHCTPHEKLLLLQKSKSVDNVKHVRLSWKQLNWLPTLQRALKTENVVVVSSNLEPEGVLGLTTCVRLERGGTKLRCFVTMDEVPEFHSGSVFYQDQLRKNFAVNVFKNGQWGTYRHLPLSQDGSHDFACDEDKSYVIVGGLGGFGLELTEWLVANGARKVVLVSRVGLQSGYQKRKIGLWRSSGVAVTVSTVDTTTKQGCLELIQKAISELGPVDGVFNLCVVLKDAFFEDQTEETFKESLSSKANIAVALDQVTRQCCKNLRYFVMFSSMSCGRGNPGQSNYGMANSVMERLCEKRRNDGLPGLAIQWGPIDDVGVYAKAMGQKKIPLQGFVAQKLGSCFKVLERFLERADAVVSSVVIAEKNIVNGNSHSVLDQLAHLLGVKDARILNKESTLADLGMDSIVGVQFAQILERGYGICIPLEDLRSLTVSEYGSNK